MKKYLFLFLLVGIPAISFSDSPKFGIKGGMYFSSLPSNLTEEAGDLTITALNDRYTGFHVGLVSSFVFPGFFIQPELLWVGTGRDMVIYQNGAHQTADYYIQRFQQVSVPVLMGMKVGPVKLGVGPVLSFMLSQQNDSTLHPDVRHSLNTATFGYQLGAGIQLGGLLLELRHEANLSRFGNGINIGGVPFDFDLRPRQLILSVGLLF